MKLFSVTLLIFSGFMKTTSGRFKVVGPAAPLVTEAGENMVLPCSIQPNFSAEDMTVKWLRADLTKTDAIVHVYEHYEDRNDNQFKSYRGRTALFKKELQTGNTSLKLSAVRPSDEGAYKCFIQDKSMSWYDEITLYVEVKAHLKVVGPAAPLVAEAGEDMVLPCSIQPNISAEDMTVEWFRLHLTDTIVHLYEAYEDKNEKQVESYRGRTALFKEELQKGNTSLKLSKVQPSDEGGYKCFVESSSWYDDVTLYVEVKGKSFHAWKIAVICISVFSIILISVTAFILQDKFSEKKLSPAQCSAIAYMRLKSEYVRKELDLKKYNTSEDGYKRLIPAITNCRKAQLAACNLSVQSIETLSATLQSPNSSLKNLDLSNTNLQESVVQLSAGLKSPHCKVEILKLAKCKLGKQSCDILLSVLQTENSSLKELDLNSNDLHDLGVDSLSDGLQSSNCKLEILRLGCCNLTLESCKSLASALQTENSSLKCLDLSNNDMQDSGVEQLSVGLKSSHCKLEILRLAICGLTVESCKSLASALQTENSSLKDLDLSNNNLQDSGVEQLSAGLKSSHCKLDILSLAICNLTMESCKFLTSVVQAENTSLKELDLSYNELQDSGVNLLASGLKSSNCKLKMLRLALCHLEEKTCEFLGSALKLANSSLKDVDLSSNDLQDSGVELLSDRLKSSNCKLEMLRLSGCLITEKGCSSLASALSSNTSHLKELDLTYNHPGDSGKKVLSARLKDPCCRLETLRLDHAGKIRIKPGMRKYVCELTLDPNTTHTHLSLSEGNRRVTWVKEQQEYPDHPERFDVWGQVLCRESLTGRCYWEAEWSDKAIIAVAYKTISRKGGHYDCGFGGNEKSWRLHCSSNSYSVCHNKNGASIHAPPSCSNRVGVYLDCPASILSFYSISSDTHTLTHLHTFHPTFTEPVYAGFRLYPDSSVCLPVCEIEEPTESWRKTFRETHTASSSVPNDSLDSHNPPDQHIIDTCPPLPKHGQFHRSTEY